MDQISAAGRAARTGAEDTGPGDGAQGDRGLNAALARAIRTLIAAVTEPSTAVASDSQSDTASAA
jgi:hypothetical protein